MSLSDIKNKLYKREAEKDLSSHVPSEYDPKLASMPVNSSEAADLWAAKKETIGVEEKKAVRVGMWALGGVIGIIALLVVVYVIKSSLFSDSRVLVSIVGPQEAQSGKLLTYEINYENDNRVSLKNLSLKITYPENFKPENNPDFKTDGLTVSTIPLTELAAKGKGTTIFNGRMYSPRGALIYLKTELIYTPSNVSTQFRTQNQLGVNVTSSPLSLEVLAPQNVSSGDEVNYLITYKNTSQDDSSNLRLKIDYPEGFVFGDANPKVSEGNNIWYIGRLSAGQEGKVTVAGKLEGERNNVKPVKVYLGTFENDTFVSYSDEQADTNIVASPLNIAQSVNGLTNPNVNPGETLRFNITYHNDGSSGLTDVIVTEKLESKVLEYSTLDTQGGFYDADKKTITWKASDHPELKNLEPGKGGSISFSINVKDIIPMDSVNDKNYVVSSLVKIDSPDIPTPIHMNKIISGNRMDMKLNSKLILDIAGYYNDSNIPNSGPIPPVVDQETTYTLRWTVRNTTNYLTGAKVEAVLPTGVTMTGKTYPENGQITYNERNNSIIWSIGNIAAGVGIISDPMEASFQVKIKPSVNQVGKPVSLLNQSVITGKDLFTGTDLSDTAKEKNTELGEDSGIGGGFEVVN